MQNKESGTVYGGFFVRLAAFIVDSLIVGTGLLFIKIPIWFASLGTDNLFDRDFIFQYSVLDIVYYVLKLCYFVLLTYYAGATLGKRLFHLKVVSSEGRKPTFFEIVFRESVGRFLSHLIFCVGYIMVGADKKKRGLHDILSDTYVVYEHKVSVAVPTPVYLQQVPYAVQPGQNQYMPGNIAPTARPQNQYMPGNMGQPSMPQNPVQGQAMPGNMGQNPMPQNPVQGQIKPENAQQNQGARQLENTSQTDTQE